MTKERYLIEWPTRWHYDESGELLPYATEYATDVRDTVEEARAFAATIKDAVADILIYREQYVHVADDFYDWEHADEFPEIYGEVTI